MVSRTQYIWSLTAGILGTALLAAYWAAPFVDHPVSTWQGLAVLPYLAAVLSAWLPLQASKRWVQTGRVQSEAVALMVAVGLLALRRPVEAAVVISAWNILGCLSARLTAQAYASLQEWQRVAEATRDRQEQGQATVTSGQVVPFDGMLVSDRAVVRPLWGDIPYVERDAGNMVWAGEVNLADAISLQVVNQGEDTLLQRVLSRAEEGIETPGLIYQRLMAGSNRWSVVCAALAVIVALGVPLLVGVAAPAALQLALAILALAMPGSILYAAILPSTAAYGACLRSGVIPADLRQLEVVAALRVMVLFEEVVHGWARILNRFAKLRIESLVLPGETGHGEGSTRRSAWRGKAVRILYGQEIPTVRSWVKRKTVIGAAVRPEKNRVILNNADVGIALGPQTADLADWLLLLGGDITKLPWVISLARRMRQTALLSAVISLLLRAGLVAYVARGHIGAMEVIAVDAAVGALIIGFSHRVGGRPGIRNVRERRKIESSLEG